MTLTKPCEQCGHDFEKPYTCSKADWGRRRFCSLACKSQSQRGKPLTRDWTPPKKPLHLRKLVPCRICGEPTQYTGPKLRGLVHCGSPDCREASRLMKNKRNSDSQRQVVEQGRRQPTTWLGVSLVSKEESMLEPWFREHGWEPQLKVLTKVSDVRLPRYARVDFGLASKKRFIEIDGTSHDKPERQARDERRDALLAAQGWFGLRIPAADVRADPESVKQRILTWYAPS